MKRFCGIITFNYLQIQTVFCRKWEIITKFVERITQNLIQYEETIQIYPDAPVSDGNIW